MTNMKPFNLEESTQLVQKQHVFMIQTIEDKFNNTCYELNQNRFDKLSFGNEIYDLTTEIYNSIYGKLNNER